MALALIKKWIPTDLRHRLNYYEGQFFSDYIQLPEIVE